MHLYKLEKYPGRQEFLSANFLCQSLDSFFFGSWKSEVRSKMLKKRHTIVYLTPPTTEIPTSVAKYKQSNFYFGGHDFFILLPPKGDVAQLVEQRTENPCVSGSIPLITTNFFRA